MTQQEFETLTGMTVDQPTFNHAEDIYLNAGSLAKADVCKEIKEHPWLLESETVAAITETAQEQTRLAAKRLVAIENLRQHFKVPISLECKAEADRLRTQKTIAVKPDPVMKRKYIDAEKLIAEIEWRRKICADIAADERNKEVAEYYRGMEVTHKEISSLITSLQQEQPEAPVDGEVHHVLNCHYLSTDNAQLCARLREFLEGAKVDIFIIAKEDEKS